MERTDITIIGAGVIGLAAAYYLSQGKNDVLVLEQYDSFGRETSSRNSEVIHAGLYYPKGSLKSETCIKGRKLLYDFLKSNNIPHKKTGKILVACSQEEEKKLNDIYENALICKVEGLRFVTSSEIHKLEPHVEAISGLFSPETGILDSHSYMKSLFNHSTNNGTEFAFDIEVIDITKTPSAYLIEVKEPNGSSFTFESKVVVNAAGLSSDKIFSMLGVNPVSCSYDLKYCKGQYFRIRNSKKFSITHPVYPPPSNIDLGIHLTPDLAGGIRLGPDANYVEDIEYDVDENTLPKFYDSIKRFLPSLEKEDLVLDTAGVRPKLQDINEDFRDFVIKEEAGKGFPGFINLIGIESPGLTASLAIAEEIKLLIENSFN